MANLGGDFDRLRVGIGRPNEKTQVADYVLGQFAKSDNEWISLLQDNINDALTHWVSSNSSKFIETLRAQKSQEVRAVQPMVKNPAKGKPEAETKKHSPFDGLKSLFFKD